MLTIVLGSIGVTFLMKTLILDKGMSQFWAGVVGVLLMLAVILTAVFVPISGYSEWEVVEEGELVAISDDSASEGKQSVYLILSEEGVYTYRYKPNGTTETGMPIFRSHQRTAKVENVEKIYISESEKPTVKKCTRQGKKTLWSFGGLFEQNKTIFYIPYETN